MEKKNYKEKDLTNDDYAKDEKENNIARTILAVLVAIAGAIFLRGSAKNNKKGK